MKNITFHGVLKIGFAVFMALLLVNSWQAAGQTAANNTMSKDSAKTYVIAIDPGHPSETSGGCAHHGLKEVAICWEVALRLQQLLAAEPTLTS
ncbi:MAG: hypothetical protein ACD_39C00339G0003, partial [uncultured bacterium]